MPGCCPRPAWSAALGCSQPHREPPKARPAPRTGGAAHWTRPRSLFQAPGPTAGEVPTDAAPATPAEPTPSRRGPASTPASLPAKRPPARSGRRGGENRTAGGERAAPLTCSSARWEAAAPPAAAPGSSPRAARPAHKAAQAQPAGRRRSAPRRAAQSPPAFPPGTASRPLSAPISASPGRLLHPLSPRASHRPAPLVQAQSPAPLFAYSAPPPYLHRPRPTFIHLHTRLRPAGTFGPVLRDDGHRLPRPLQRRRRLLVGGVTEVHTVHLRGQRRAWAQRPQPRTPTSPTVPNTPASRGQLRPLPSRSSPTGCDLPSAAPR